MKNSKLIKTLSTFTSKEFKEFEKRANSVFYKSEKHLQFIKIIANHFPNFNEDKINKQKVFSQIYKKEAYADIRIRELMSALNKVLREYLVFLQNSTNKFQYELDLLRQYNDRKLESLYSSQLKVVKAILRKDQFKNKEYFRRMFLLASVENDHFSKKNIRALDGNIQTMMNNLDYFYFSTKLIETCEMLNRQMVLNQQYELHLFDEIESLINNHKASYFTQPTIICYYEIYKLFLNDDNIEQLDLTIKTLKEHNKFFTNNELKTLFDFPQNYCIRNVNKGNDKYLKNLFDLQIYLLDKEFNLVNTYISGGSYINIVSIAIKLQEFNWAKNFIEEYKEKVEPSFQENSYNLNKANLFYYTGEYVKTIRFLNQVEFTDALLATYAKIILLKTYYAEKEYETLAYFITSFKLYIKRNNHLNNNFKKSTDVFLNNFKKIFNVAEKIDFIDKKKLYEKLSAIQDKINKEKSILNKVWLLEILEELKK